MPQHTTKKKKKGRAPAHQNTFAFSHNPNSKKTLKILEAPNTHVCRRCHDKIEWRKQYRKYKPRTQPGKCNICQQRRVLAAYHTICEKCSTSEKAKKTVREHLKELEGGKATQVEENADHSEEVEEPLGETEAKEQTEVAPDNTTSAEDGLLKNSGCSVTSGNDTNNNNTGRACAMCVKDFALPDSDDEEEQDPLLASGKRIPLRQRKALERQREKQNSKNSSRNKERQDTNDDNNDDEPEDDYNDSDFEKEEDEEEDDPFLKAVGGADKLLTGEAYQKSLLQKEEQQQRMAGV